MTEKNSCQRALDAFDAARKTDADCAILYIAINPEEATVSLSDGELLIYGYYSGPPSVPIS